MGVSTFAADGPIFRLPGPGGIRESGGSRRHPGVLPAKKWKMSPFPGWPYNRPCRTGTSTSSAARSSHRLVVRHAVRPAADGVLRLHRLGALPDLHRALPADPAAQLRQHPHRGRRHRPQHEPPAARSRGDDQARRQRRAAGPHRRVRHRRDRRHRQAAADPRRVARAGHAPRAHRRVAPVPRRRAVRGVPRVPAVAPAGGVRRPYEHHSKR